MWFYCAFLVSNALYEKAISKKYFKRKKCPNFRFLKIKNMKILHSYHFNSHCHRICKVQLIHFHLQIATFDYFYIVMRNRIQIYSHLWQPWICNEHYDIWNVFNLYKNKWMDLRKPKQGLFYSETLKILKKIINST